MIRAFQCSVSEAFFSQFFVVATVQNPFKFYFREKGTQHFSNRIGTFLTITLRIRIFYTHYRYADIIGFKSTITIFQINFFAASFMRGCKTNRHPKADIHTHPNSKCDSLTPHASIKHLYVCAYACANSTLTDESITKRMLKNKGRS